MGSGVTIYRLDATNTIRFDQFEAIPDGFEVSTTSAVDSDRYSCVTVAKDIHRRGNLPRDASESLGIDSN